MVRGHDHADDRYEIYPAYEAHPVLTTVALSRRLDREAFGPFERVPTIARWVPGALPQVHRLHVPPRWCARSTSRRARQRSAMKTTTWQRRGDA
jgi:hypothetical protein